MSATNHTTNYNLPQFVGTDKPAWLGDINPAFSTIDTKIKEAKTAGDQGVADALVAKNRADSAYTLADDANTAAGTAQGTANTAAGTASATALALDAFEKKFNINASTSNCNVSAITGTIGTQPKLSQNSDGSIFKFYGFMQVTASGGSSSIAKTAVAGLSGVYGVPTGCYLTNAPDTAYVINGACTTSINNLSDNNVSTISINDIAVGTDGQIYIYADTFSNNVTQPANTYSRAYFPPCVYFNATFGDDPISQ